MDMIWLIIFWISLSLIFYLVSLLKWSKKSISESESEWRSDVGPSGNCVRCNKGIVSGRLLGQPLSCHICCLRVCRPCAIWDKSSNLYTCGHCHPPKSVGNKYWFNDLTASKSWTWAEGVKGTKDVREHLEGLVQRHLHAPIHSVSLAKLSQHPQYELFFHQFHGALSQGLINLAYSLKLAIENKPMSETPTSAHSTLTQLLDDVEGKSMELPYMELRSCQDWEGKEEEMGEGSYEDALATAVLNKAIEKGQKGRAETPLSLVDSAVQTDSELSEKSDYNVGGWVRNLEGQRPSHPNLSDDDMSLGTSSSNWSHEGSNKLKDNQRVVIEEEVEEIRRTYDESDDSDMSNPPPIIRSRKGRKTARQRNSELSASSPQGQVHEPSMMEETMEGMNLELFSQSRVPFPEGGVDIVESTVQDDDPTGLLVSQISEWEHNWLFKRRKQLLRRRNLMAEAVPMLVPNPNEDGVSPQIGDDNISDISDFSDHVDQEEEKNSSEQDESPLQLQPLQVPHQARPTNKAAKNKTIPQAQKIEFQVEPKDLEVAQGKTARFYCKVADSSPQHSVAWFINGQLLTSKEGKVWIYSHTSVHYLYIYSVSEEDVGPYSISLFDFKGNETKFNFNLQVKRGGGLRKEAPNFTVLQNRVEVNGTESVVNVPFKITGYPQPSFTVYKNNVEITKLSHVLLEEDEDGDWKLELRRDETELSVEGEYVAVAKNSEGTIRVTFTVQDGRIGFDGPTSPVPRAVSALSEGSSIGETLRETSHTLNRNQTLNKEDYEAALLKDAPMSSSLSEREKLKWANPVELKNNPYAPENLAKRIRDRELGSFSLPQPWNGEGNSSEDDPPPPNIQRTESLKKFSRDYYVHGGNKSDGRWNSTQSLTSNSSREGSKEKDEMGKRVGEKKRLNPTPSVREGKVGEVGQVGNISLLPSVKQLAQQFQVGEAEVVEVKKVGNPHLSRLFQKEKSSQQVHSLTARSVSKEFRDGLKLSQSNVPKMELKVEAKADNSEPQSSIPIKYNVHDKSRNIHKGTSSNSHRPQEQEPSLPSDQGGRNNILARAAFWDKRVHEKIIIDHLVLDQFPKL